MTVLGIDIDLREDFRAEILDAECKCESPHVDPIPPCSVKVTHRVTLCMGQFMVCEAAAKDTAEQVANCANIPCPFCGKFIADDWRVTPA